MPDQYDYQPGKSTDQVLDDLNRLQAKPLEETDIAVAVFMDTKKRSIMEPLSP